MSLRHRKHHDGCVCRLIRPKPNPCAICPTGPVGPQGPSGVTGSIIPFASGLPVTMTAPGGGHRAVGLIGFGSSTSAITTNNPLINLTGDNITLLNFAFSMPRAGTIDSIAAFFSATPPETPDGTVTVRASLYQSVAPDNIFTQIPGTLVTLAPTFTLPGLGVTANGVVTGIGFRVTIQTRLLLVFDITSDAGGGGDPITGYASAGVNIL